MIVKLYNELNDSEKKIVDGNNAGFIIDSPLAIIYNVGDIFAIGSSFINTLLEMDREVTIITFGNNIPDDFQIRMKKRIISSLAAK